MIRGIRKCCDHLAGANCFSLVLHSRELELRGKHTTKLPLDLENHIPVRILSVESFVYTKQLVSQAEQRSAAGICELFSIGERESLPAALDDLVSVLVGDVEGVAAERPDLFFHDEGGLLLGAVVAEDPERRRDCCERHLVVVGIFALEG